MSTVSSSKTIYLIGGSKAHSLRILEDGMCVRQHLQHWLYDNIDA